MVRVLQLSAGYFVIAALLHWWVFPEPAIPDRLKPCPGDTLVNGPAGETVRFLEIGTTTRLRVVLKPGGAIPTAHIHAATRETFELKSGNIEVQIGEKWINITQGEKVIIEPGTAHTVRNRTQLLAVFEVTLENAGLMPVALEQVHRYLATTQANELSRFLQMLRFADRYKIYMGHVPILVQRAGISLLSPSARILGYRSFYPPSLSGIEQ